MVLLLTCPVPYDLSTKPDPIHPLLDHTYLSSPYGGNKYVYLNRHCAQRLVFEKKFEYFCDHSEQKAKIKETYFTGREIPIRDSGQTEEELRKAANIVLVLVKHQVVGILLGSP